MTTNPLVTVAVSSYNNGRFIEETLDSIYNQTYQHIELVIIEDASKDDSAAIITGWLKTHAARFANVIFVQHETNKGVPAVGDAMFMNATGEFISFIASDDLMMPYKIEEQVSLFNTLDDTYGVVYGDLIEVDSAGRPIKEPNFSKFKKEDPDWKPYSGYVFPKMIDTFLFYLQTTLIRRKLFLEYNFSFKAGHVSEDWYVLLFFSRRCNVMGVDRVYTHYRIHDTSVSAQIWTEERYHTWCLSHVYMNHDVYAFEKNSREEKEQIAAQIQQNLMKYAYHPRAVYKTSMEAWRTISGDVGMKKALSLFFYIHWFPLKRMFKRS